MKIKLDENIPRGLAETLGALGHEVDTTAQEGLQGRDDEDVWAAAQQVGALFVTQDLDFSDLRAFQPGTHHGILLVCLREPGRAALASRIQTLFESEDTDGWPGAFVVATERKVRVRRAQD